MNAQDRFQVASHSDGFISFRVENQGCAQWAIRSGDDAEDPPVYESNDRVSWHDTHRRVSEFFVGVALQEALFAPVAGDNAPIADGFEPDASSGVVLLATAPHGVPFTGSRYYGALDVLVVDHAGTWLFVAGPDEARVDAVRRGLAMEWALRP